MALRFADSFDHYATAQIQNKWTSDIGGGCTINAGTGRFGTGGLNGGQATRGVAKLIDSQPTWIVQWAFQVATLGTYSLLTLHDGGTLHTDLRMDATGHLFFTRNGTTIGSVGTTPLIINTWYRLAAKVTISDTVGVAALQINEVSELNGTSLDTRNGGNSTADTIRLMGIGPTAGAIWIIDDVVIMDGIDQSIAEAGSPTNNDFLGDVRVSAIQPASAGNYSQWTPSTGSNFQNVDETTPNSDTDYNSSATATNKDTFVFPDIPTLSGNILGVQHNLWARKDDAGTRFIAPMSRQGGTDYVSAVTHSIGDTYTYHRQVKGANPATTAAWTVADVNTNSEFGYRLES